MPLPNLFPNPLHLRTQWCGLQHFHGFAHGEEFLHKVEWGTQIVTEDGVMVGALQLFLRVMQRKGTQVVRLIVVHFQFGDLQFIVAEDDAETITWGFFEDWLNMNEVEKWLCEYKTLVPTEDATITPNEPHKKKHSQTSL